MNEKWHHYSLGSKHHKSEQLYDDTDTAIKRA